MSGSVFHLFDETSVQRRHLQEGGLLSPLIAAATSSGASSSSTLTGHILTTASGRILVNDY